MSYLNITFPSLHRKNIHYVVDKSSFEFSKSPQLADYAYEWDDLGDKGVQHTPKNFVMKDDAADYIASLVAYLIASPLSLDDKEYYFILPMGVNAEEVIFLSKLEYVSDKTRYFNRQDKKISASDSKRHDKRWKEVPQRAGHIDEVIRELIPQAPTAMEYIHTHFEVGEVLKTAVPYPLGYTREEWRGVHEAYRSLHTLITGHRMIASAKSCLSCFIHNYKNSQLNNQIAS